MVPWEEIRSSGSLEARSVKEKAPREGSRGGAAPREPKVEGWWPWGWGLGACRADPVADAVQTDRGSMEVGAVRGATGKGCPDPADPSQSEGRAQLGTRGCRVRCRAQGLLRII